MLKRLLLAILGFALLQVIGATAARAACTIDAPTFTFSGSTVSSISVSGKGDGCTDAVVTLSCGFGPSAERTAPVASGTTWAWNTVFTASELPSGCTCPGRLSVNVVGKKDDQEICRANKGFPISGCTSCPSIVDIEVKNPSGTVFQPDPDICLPPGIYQFSVLTPVGSSTSYSWSVDGTAVGDYDSNFATGTLTADTIVSVAVAVPSCPPLSAATTLNICGEKPPKAVCGNGIVESSETCDGDCPTSCNDNNRCTIDSMLGSPASCNAQCSHVERTNCDDNGGGGGSCGVFAWCCWLLGAFAVLYVAFWVMFQYNVVPAAYYVGAAAGVAFVLWIAVCRPELCTIILALFAAGVVALGLMGLVALIPTVPAPIPILAALPAGTPAVVLTILTLILLPLAFLAADCTPSCSDAVTCLGALWNQVVGS